MHTYHAKVLKWLDPKSVALEIDLGFRTWQLQTIYFDSIYRQDRFPPKTECIVHTQMQRVGKDHKYYGMLSHYR